MYGRIVYFLWSLFIDDNTIYSVCEVMKITRYKSVKYIRYFYDECKYVRHDVFFVIK